MNLPYILLKSIKIFLKSHKTFVIQSIIIPFEVINRAWLVISGKICPISNMRSSQSFSIIGKIGLNCIKSIRHVTSMTNVIITIGKIIPTIKIKCVIKDILIKFSTWTGCVIERLFQKSS
ncbi:hypothetical protein BpHYR1_041470 [Brachionus plicatilis]|uniref:Uncharacterized protein n=1 Tax=Brachionus plicatilis TaxID=10195 RepID=A0A3M7PZU3_BRAPC|nr:hypothetical protein BpHYR1_041470 [Brachionus plicatilis]